MNLLFCVNQGYVELLQMCLTSVVRHGGESRYEAYILHSDLPEQIREEISSRAGERVHCHFLPVEASLFAGLPESRRYPRQIYYRLAAPLLLPPELDRILYLDVDTLVINPLAPLYHMDFQGNYYIACTHVRRALTRLNARRLRVAQNVPYVNTGVMMLNLQALRENLTMEALSRAAEQIDSFLLPDQDLLTVLHGDKILLADTQRYNLSDRILNVYNASHPRAPHDLDWVRGNTVILHFCGKNRPWNQGYVGKLGVFFRELNF